MNQLLWRGSDDRKGLANKRMHLSVTPLAVASVAPAGDAQRYADMSQMDKLWETFSREFFRDGSLRDIYVFDTDIEGWRAALHFITGNGYRIEFTGSWEGSTFPPELESLFVCRPSDQGALLTIDVAKVNVACHFFCRDEIEFDLDPASVDTPGKLSNLFGFMRGLADSVGTDAVLTPENMRDTIIFRARPGAQEIEHTPFGGFD